jgi:hypothetical protein
MLGHTSDSSHEAELILELDRLVASWGLQVSAPDRGWLMARARMVSEDCALLAAVARDADDAMPQPVPTTGPSPDR